MADVQSTVVLKYVRNNLKANEENNRTDKMIASNTGVEARKTPSGPHTGTCSLAWVWLTTNSPSGKEVYQDVEQGLRDSHVLHVCN